ncbi:hypothetical protein [Nitrosomonas sp. Nm34]|uniref:hypothetical protein n=1 Tax=Nitrosomonas sp. Nm34 TaxID=1881055 RepID=UPI0008E6C91A|nr:hypothetical protein [Nitrosomonas sp. Nm34]SFJ01496.1 hypothetical protein SAMN05428978_10825 [Nitrosomonas sp. Nm34]
MELNRFIEIGEKKAGKQIELAKILGISDSYIRVVKTGRRGFPVDICILLADYIDADRMEVVAASNLVTEKDEKKRKIFERCLKKTSNAAASIATVIVLTTVLTLSPVRSSQAAGLEGNQASSNVYYVK